ncbi:MAG: hypothetical protein AAF654_10170 [Myxococcota bacterium]
MVGLNRGSTRIAIGRAYSGAVGTPDGGFTPAPPGSNCILPSGDGGLCANGFCVVGGCGDGIVDRNSGEECDDALLNGQDRATCTASCATNVCGDGFVQSGIEQCDLGDQNGVAGSTCTNTCRDNRCGDGHLGPDEECDLGEDNNGVTGSTCLSGCRSNACGDGFQGSGEACDAGIANGTDGQPCTSACTLTGCGDGQTGGLEECDDGANNGDPTSDCTIACTLQRAQRERRRWLVVHEYLRSSTAAATLIVVPASNATPARMWAPALTTVTKTACSPAAVTALRGQARSATTAT